MERDELGGLSREQLLELVRRRQEELAAREAAIERRDEADAMEFRSRPGGTFSSSGSMGAQTGRINP